MSEPSDFLPGQRVLYVPNHAHGDMAHPDCERGIVSSTNERFVFVRYYLRDGGLQDSGVATDPDDLRDHNAALAAQPKDGNAWTWKALTDARG